MPLSSALRYSSTWPERVQSSTAQEQTVSGTLVGALLGDLPIRSGWVPLTVGLVVAATAVADQIDHRTLELHAVVDGGGSQLTASDHRHFMEDQRLDHFASVRTRWARSRLLM
jgi:hypothetical protein